MEVRSRHTSDTSPTRPRNAHDVTARGPTISYVQICSNFPHDLAYVSVLNRGHSIERGG